MKQRFVPFFTTPITIIIKQTLKREISSSAVTRIVSSTVHTSHALQLINEPETGLQRRVKQRVGPAT